MSRIKHFLFGFAVLLLSAAVFAYDKPDQIVAEFLLRDSKGERLSSKVSEKIDNLQTDNQFEPAWDTSVAITSYFVKSIKINGDVAVASVLFMNSWTTSDEFDVKNVKDEQVEIHLRKTKDCWKISPPFTMPRILPGVLLKHFERLVDEDKATSVGKRFLFDDEKRLNALRRYIRYIEGRGKEKK